MILLNRALTNAACSDLVSYTRANVVGTARVHTNFKSFMTSFGNLAASCSAKIYITSSFRSAGSSVTNTVVPPASYSNHSAGYAIELTWGHLLALLLVYSMLLFGMLGYILIIFNMKFIYKLKSFYSRWARLSITYI